MAEADEAQTLTSQMVSTEVGIQNVPGDLIQEIISRLPIDSVFQSRCVSHFWHSLTNDYRLAMMHYKRSLQNSKPTDILFLSNHLLKKSVLHYMPNFQKCDHGKSTLFMLNKFPFASDLPRFSLLGSCNGFICLIDFDFISTWRGIVCNPVTGNWFKLPVTPISESDYYPFCPLYIGFGYSPKTNEFKVIRIPAFTNDFSENTQNFTTDLVVEIVTLGSDSSWRSLGAVPRTILNSQRFGIYVNGALHWLKFHDDLMLLGVWTFDIENERFSLVPVPDALRKKVTRGLLYLVVLGGCLAMVDYSQDDVQQVWVMTEYGVEESWILKFAISTPPKRGREFQASGILRPLAVKDDGKILLEFDCIDLFSYDPENGRLEKLIVPGLPWAFRAFPHVGTLVSFEDVTARED